MKNVKDRREYMAGYDAGVKRKITNVTREMMVRRRREFKRRVYLSVLPMCLEAKGWKDEDGRPIESLIDRIKMAQAIATLSAMSWPDEIRFPSLAGGKLEDLKEQSDGRKETK